MSEKEAIIRKNNFQKLTPATNISIEPYRDAFNFVLKNDDLRNIGIIGPYGAGKSSVLESFKNSHKELNFLNISVAKFNDSPSKKTDTNSSPIHDQEEATGDDPVNYQQANTTAVNINIIECKILNQLLHQIDPKKIPCTKFTIKEPLSIIKFHLSSALAVLFILSICYQITSSGLIHIRDLLDLLNFTNLFSSESSNSLSHILEKLSTIPLLIFLSIIYNILFMGYVFYNLIKVQKEKNLFKSLSLHGATLEVQSGDDSYFIDKYLSEVIYCFKQSGADVIIFEDIDRYEEVAIFQRLREINLLINKKSSDKIIRFFYVVRDDMLESKERTKFFDFIIPIIPFVDNSNSHDLLMDNFKSDKISEGFINAISLYIDDMRTIKNIYNEYHIYYAVIGNNQLKHDKLLALIIYKNLFSSDFASLQYDKGFVKTIFNEIYAHNINQQQEIRTKKEILDDELDDIEESDEDARKLKLKEIDKNNIELKKCCILTSKEIFYQLYGGDSREEILEKIRENNKEDHSIYTIIENRYSSLIIYLIRNGYIDFTYRKYMTHFHGKTIELADSNFLFSITDNDPQNYDYQLISPEKVFKRLPPYSFDNLAILNFNFLDYLFDRKDIENQKNLIELVKNNKKYDFIEGYLNYAKESKYYNYIFDLLATYWRPIIILFISDKVFSNKVCYVNEMLVRISSDRIKVINQANILTNFISKYSDFLNDNLKDEQYREKLFNLNIKFVELESIKENEELLDIIYKNNLYALNFKAIELFIDRFYIKKYKAEQVNNQSYTIIMEEHDSPLAKYIEENFIKYLSVIIDNCNGKITDSKENVIYILNHDSLTDELKCSYIDKLDYKLSDITDIIHGEVLEYLLEKEKLEYSERNIECYYSYFDYKIPEILSTFINNNADSYNFDFERELWSVKESVEANENTNSTGDDTQRDIDEIINKFIDSVITCHELDYNQYTSILNALPCEFTNFTYVGLAEDKLKFLLENHFVVLTVKNYEFVMKNYSLDASNSLILTKIDDYIKLVKDGIITDTDELFSISMKLENDKKIIELFKLVAEPINIDISYYSDTVSLYILERAYSQYSLDVFIDERYTLLSEENSEKLVSIIIEQIDNIIADTLLLPAELCMQIFKRKDELAVEDIEQFFLNHLDSLSKDETKLAFELLGYNKLIPLFTKHIYILPKSQFNKKILENFKSKNWIRWYKINEKNLNTYKVSIKTTKG